ncbi:MAG: membrane protein insertion efficiency factor YidD [Kiritimatiellae bacterium]|nr:membrane protein insertion efficiency factor YidD [Kiritimatiellia bacterium]
MRLRLCLASAFLVVFAGMAQAGPAIGGPPPDLARFLPSSRPLRLAESLFAEADYPAASIEARIVQRETEDAYALAKARLLRAIADLRRPDTIPGAVEQAAATLDDLWTAEPADGEGPEFVELRAFAAYELGRYRMFLGKGAPDAFPPLAHAFLRTRNIGLFQLAGCSLHFLFSENGDLARANPDLAAQVDFCLSAWPTPVWTRANPRTSGLRDRPGRSSVAFWPVREFIAFYRTQISPAIGSRCALVPSCSEYFLQASRKHGLLGLPLIADRFVREPDVTQSAKVWIERPDGSVRIADPVADHDFWFAESP